MNVPRALPGLLVVTLALPAAAHGPLTKRFRAAPPGTPVPAAAPVVPGPPPGALRSAVSNVRPLRVLAAEAMAIVLARVTRTEALDAGRLHLHHLRVARVLRGRLAEAGVGIVDMRGASTRPPLLGEGDRAVVLVRPAPPLSYLAAHVPPGMAALTVVGGRFGVVAVGSAAEWAAVERAVAEGAAVASLDGEAALAARRRLAFAELAGPSRPLAADALLELRELPALAPLTGAEVDVLARALANDGLDAATRAGLIALVGERGATDALPALRTAAADTPAVLDALLGARARLGAAAGREELADDLGAEDPAVRAAAVRALARVDDPGALADVGRRATGDPDLGVRVAAVEALGEARRPAALPVLARTFDDPAAALRQSSARALLAIGGPRADQALVDLALRGESTETRTYAALVLLFTRGRDHPAVRRLAEASPGADVRHVLDRGVEFGGAHAHR